MSKYPAVRACALRKPMIHVGETLRVPLTFELGLRVQALLDWGERHIVLDLSRLSRMDAAGAGELVRVFNMALAAGARLEIIRPERRVRELLDSLGLLSLLSCGARGPEDSAWPGVGGAPFHRRFARSCGSSVAKFPSRLRA